MKLFAPEVLQTSSMDCGPACLKSLLEGIKGPLSYGRLREACQTSIDGTSIDEMEEVAIALGYDAEQVVMPIEAVRSDAAPVLPSITAIVRDDGALHFIVLWRRIGQRIQVMDPARGRSWMRIDELDRKLHHARIDVEAEEWREWVETDESLALLRARAQHLGHNGAGIDRWLATASSDSSWFSFAALDAAMRFAAHLVREGVISRGAAAIDAVDELLRASAEEQPDEELPTIDPRYWSVRQTEDEEGVPTLSLTGGVFLRARPTPPRKNTGHELLPALATVTEPPDRPLLALWQALGGFEKLISFAGMPLLAVIAVALVAESIVLRALLEIWPNLGLGFHRVQTVAMLLLLLLALAGLEFGFTRTVLLLARRLEFRLRRRFVHTLPLISDDYFSSRPVADMIHRVHALQSLPEFTKVIARCAVSAVMLTALITAIGWLAPPLALAAFAIGATSIIIPLAFQRILVERAVRHEESSAALGVLELDALRGSRSLRGLGAEIRLRASQREPLHTWIRTVGARLRLEYGIEIVLLVLGVGGAIILVSKTIADPALAGRGLLLAYWVLAVPWLSLQLGEGLQRIPGTRSVMLRLLEPLSAPKLPPPTETTAPAQTGPVSIEMSGVTVVMGGHTVVHSLDLELKPGEHVAVVGRSGAGKSTLLGLLLGWYQPASGSIRIDGSETSWSQIRELNRRTVWVDPAVHLWDKSVLHNLEYGNDESLDVASIVRAAKLDDPLERLPNGLSTPIGDDGCHLSGGEGQRVRLGRGLARKAPGLILLDEPFRGLDRNVRRELQETTRSRWHDATMLYVTHDIEDTTRFDRIIVVEDGTIIEDACPDQLLADPQSRYATLVEEAQRVQKEVWAPERWSHLALRDGKVE